VNVKLFKSNGEQVQVKINGEMELPSDMLARFPFEKRFFVTLLEDINEALIKGGTFTLNTIRNKSDLVISGI
jgi:hypothetical protein